MKECFKCKISKPLSDFYKHPKMPDGHLGKCKECTKKDVAENREDKLDYYLKYDRNRPNHAERNIKRNVRDKEKYHSCEEYRLAAVERKERWRQTNPHKRSAQNAANKAVRDGRLERKYFCEHCGVDGKLQKHHWSYEKEHWLDVVWLCSGCHGREHARLNALGRDPDTLLSDV